MLKHWRGNLTLEGVGRQLGGMEELGQGEEREKEMHTTPLLFKNIYIIDKAWLLQEGTIAHWSFISQAWATNADNTLAALSKSLVQDKASAQKRAMRGNKKQMQRRGCKGVKEGAGSREENCLDNKDKKVSLSDGWDGRIPAEQQTC